MIEGYVTMEKPRVEDMEELQRLAAEDRHSVVYPTHVLKKNGKIVGYFSVAPAFMPTVLAWLSTQEMAARESFHLINSVEYQTSMCGAQAVMWPVPKTSPFFPIMQHLGYTDTGEYHLFVKKV